MLLISTGIFFFLPLVCSQLLSFLLSLILFIYLFLAVLDLPYGAGFSLVAESRGCSSIAVILLLRSTGSGRAGFSSRGSRALEHRLNNCGTRA